MSLLDSGRFRSIVDALDSRLLADLGTRPLEMLSSAQRRELADIHRRRGALQQALACLDADAGEPPDERTAYLRAVLAGTPGQGTSRRDRFWPSPFALVDDLLSEEQADGLLAVAVAGIDQQQAATIDGRRLDPSVRSALSMALPAPWTEIIGAAIRTRLDAVLPILRIAPLGAIRISAALLCNRNGDFYVPHRDDDTAGGRRVVSFVYYLHRRPKPFSGGDLLLHDTFADAEAGAADFDGSHYTRITPQHNCAVFFPSAITHEVTPMRVDNDAPANRRFAVACWISPAATPP